MIPPQIHHTLLTSATNLGDAGVDDVYGWRLVNLSRAVNGSFSLKVKNTGLEPTSAATAHAVAQAEVENSTLHLFTYQAGLNLSKTFKQNSLYLTPSLTTHYVGTAANSALVNIIGAYSLVIAGNG